MGAHPYQYVVDYEEPLQRALDRLREREFEAGRYNPVLMFPLRDPEAAPGKAHASIEEAMVSADADGTRSILDISAIADAPAYSAAAPLSDEELSTLFETLQPPVEALETPPSGLYELIERGMARYVVGYEDGQPRRVLFIGYSYD